MEYKNFGYLNLANEDRHRRLPKKKKSEFLNVLLFYVLPFIVINAIIFFVVTAQPDFEVTLGDNPGYESQEFQVKIKSIFPKKDFYVTIDQDPVELEQDGKLYSGIVNHNGTLEVSLTNINGMNKTVYENISSIDDEPPIITQDDSETGYVSVYIEDTQSGVDFDSLYGVDSDGNVISPSTLDEGDGWAVFYYDTPSIDVHVFDKAGRESIATYGREEAAAASEENADEGDISISE